MKSLKLFSLSLLIAFALLKDTARAAADWLTDLPKAKAKAKAEGKYVFIHFSGSDWCGWCMKLRKDVFLKPDFVSYAQSNLVLVRIDFPKHTPLPAASQKANQKLAEQFQVQGYPTLILLDGHGVKLGIVNYGHGGTKQFLMEVEKVIRPQPELVPSKAPTRKGADLRRADKKPRPAETNRTDLTLRKITGSKQRRQVVINNQTLSVGETATVRLSTGHVKVRCVEIREKSVVVSVGGEKERRELRLVAGT